MGKIRRIFPFGFWPAHWGLSGSLRSIAEAEYYWEGEDLDYRLLDINISDKDSKEYRTAKLKLDYRYHKVGEFDYGLGLIENDIKLTENECAKEVAKYLNRYGRISAEDLEYKLFELSHELKDTEVYYKEKLKLDVKYGKKTQEQADRELVDSKHEDKTTIEYQIAQLDIDLKWGKINQNEYEKRYATLLREPWFNVIGADQTVVGDNVQMAFELDWNEYFIQFLEKQGWTGITPDEIVDRWFESAMKQMVNIEDIESIDDGNDDPLPMAGAGRFKRDDGLTEYR